MPNHTPSAGIHRVTRHRHVTYLGVPAEVWQYHANSTPTGERVSALRWLADSEDQNGVRAAGTLSLRHIKGDGRIASEFQEFDSLTVVDGTDEDADRYAQARLAAG